MPRPDGQPDKLGLAILDEPAAQQTDPTVRVQMLIHACVDQESVSTWQKDMADRHRQAYSCEGITGAGSAIAGNLHTGSAAAHGGAVGRKCCREPPEDHHLDAGVCLSGLPTMFVCGIFSRAHMRARTHSLTHSLTTPTRTWQTCTAETRRPRWITRGQCQISNSSCRCGARRWRRCWNRSLSRNLSLRCFRAFVSPASYTPRVGHP